MRRKRKKKKEKGVKKLKKEEKKKEERRRKKEKEGEGDALGFQPAAGEKIAYFKSAFLAVFTHF